MTNIVYYLIGQTTHYPDGPNNHPKIKFAGRFATIREAESVLGKGTGNRIVYDSDSICYIKKRA